MKARSLFAGAAAALSLAASVGAGSAQAATVVNLDALTNASLDGSNGVMVGLDAGTYSLSFVKDGFTAFSRFAASGDCNDDGGACSIGYENSVGYVIDGTRYLFGDNNGLGQVGPQSTGGYYDTAERAFAASSQFGAASPAGTFTLTGKTKVTFFIGDDYVGDNRGGVSVAISAVPEPAAWGMMMLGFGAAGATLRRRSAKATTKAGVRFA